jgi:hypothetical protein
MPAKSRNRKILLVGSVPLANSKEVFIESAARLGELIPRIPDGEIGVHRKGRLYGREDARSGAEVPALPPFELNLSVPVL